MIRSIAGAVFAVAVAASAPAAMAQQLNVIHDPAGAPAGAYTLDPTHASVTLKLAHMGLSHFTMRFDKMDGGYSFDPAHPAASKVTFTIDPASVDTGNAPFNTEIAEQFLETGKYPTIGFTSTSVVPGPNGHGKMTGDLTFHGVTKPVTLDVDYRGFVAMMGQQRQGFSASTVIRRSEFGVTKYVPMVGDEVTVLVELEFTKK